MNRNRFIVCIFLLSFVFLLSQKVMSQGITKDSLGIKKRVYNIACDDVRSFCDSAIDYSSAYFNTPIWFKMSIGGDLNKLSILCTSVQYLDSAYVLDNTRWFECSVFDFSPFSIGVFYHNGYLFEFDLDISMNNASIETLFSKSDSIVTLLPWDSHAKPKYLTRKIEFPHYCQLYGMIYLNESKIIIEKKNSTFDVKKKIKKRTKPRQ
jgi:hypothetical protein